MAKGKFTTHKQAIYINKETGHFTSAKYAKQYPKKVTKKIVTIKKAK